MIFRPSCFNVSLEQTDDQKSKGICGTELEECGDDLLIDGSTTTIDRFMLEIGPQEAERMASEWARKSGEAKRGVDDWGFLGFDATDLAEIPKDRNSDVRKV